MGTDWQVFPDRQSLFKAAIKLIRRCEAASSGDFSIVLAGGRTPLELYRMLIHEPMQWEKWRVYFGDERCLPPGHAERNSVQAMQALLSHVPIPAAHIFVPPAELGPVVAASRYNTQLENVGEFDLVLLGLGEDGHTAGLFPGHDPGLAQGAANVMPVINAPKPPAERISLSARRLSRARQVLFLVSGAAKREAVSRWKKGDALPASLIFAAHGVTVLADEGACPRELDQHKPGDLA
jgi:6-phosphogluconolactonase